MHPTCAPSRRPESSISFLSMLMSPPTLYEPGFAEGASINKLEDLGKSDTVSPAQQIMLLPSFETQYRVIEDFARKVREKL